VQESESNQKYIQTGRRSKEYLMERAQGKTLVKLKTLHPKLTYDAEEVTYQGAFPDDYTGKLYQDAPSSEVLSMGMQKLYDDTIKFATDDPAHFKFVVNTLRGFSDD
jgi:hypothetical protein